MFNWSRRYRRNLLLTGTLVLGSLLTWWAFASGDVTAQTATTFSVESVGERIGLGNADLRQVGINVIRWLLGFVTLVAVVYLIYGGWLWLTAAGNEQRIEKAKQVILQAMIGLVIIILAWAIVLFVARTVANSTSNGNTNIQPPCIGFGCPAFNPQTFDLTAVTTCAQPQEFDENVPRSSNVSLTFNHDVSPASVQAAVTPGHNLVVEWCEDDDGDPATPPASPADCSQRKTTVKPLQNQVYSGTAPVGVAGTPLAEWVAYDNTVTFYHTSFSTDETNSDNQYFYPNQKYRVTIPAKDSAPGSTSLRDTTNPGRILQACQRNAAGAPIPGGGCDNTPPAAITWTFETGTDTAGADLNIQRTVPSSNYLPLPLGTGTGTPDRNVDRENYTFAVDFTQAIDWNSAVTPDNNFQLYKFTTAPDVNNGTGGVLEASSQPGSNFVLKRAPSGTGARLQVANGIRLEPFTWYKAVAKNFRSLCGTEQLPNPFEWVFQTNDNVAGVQFVYPGNGDTNICPDSEVFVKFSTSMYNLSSSSTTCQPASSGSYVRTGTLSPNPGRGFVVMDEFDPVNPNANCTKYGFVPTTTLLPIGPVTASVTTNLVIDQSGSTLNRSWSFSTTDANSCVQRPYIDRVSPASAPAGFCVSVLGNYFEKKQPGQPREADGQGSDSLLLETVNQGTAKSWKNRVIVSRVDDGSPALATGPHPYKVSLDYGGSIGTLESNTINLNLEAGSGAPGVCLIDVNPDSGPPGANTTLSGEGFGSFGAASVVPYSGGPNWSVNPAGWTDTRISPATVPDPYPVTLNGRVRVQPAVGPASNEVAFDVTPPGGSGGTGSTIPRVVEETQCNLNLAAGPVVIPSPNPMRNDNQACINTKVTGRFTLDMNVGTINGTNIFLQKCDPTCGINIGAAVTAPTIRSFGLTPNLPLEPSTRYQVTLTTGVTSLGPPTVPLASPYTWQFTTKAGNADCPIDAVTATTADAFGNAVQASPTRYVFRTTAYGVNAAADSVDAQCRTLNNTGVTYAWDSSNLQVAVLTSASGATTLAHDPSSPINGSSTITVTAESKNATFEVVYDQVSCQTSADCSSIGPIQCPGSVCVANRCTPVVNSIAPDKGPVGKYMTVRGCWFGGYDSVKSKVIFRGDTAIGTDDRDGLIPDTNICGSASGTWLNTYIVREVPDRSTPVGTDDAVSGPIRVNRFDDAQADGPTFTVNSDPLGSNLCKLNPVQGVVTTALIASGFGFGADEPAKRTAQDQVNITNLASSGLKVMNTYASWEDTKIGTAIPAAAEAGTSEVRVVNENAAGTSNPWPFEVTTAGAGSCAARCTVDGDCPAGQGCGNSFCCGSKPRIVSTSPPQGATNVCRNVQVGVTFDQVVNIQPGVVWYSDNGIILNGRAFAQGATVNYQPGLLSANTNQRLSLNSNLIRSQQGVSADVTFSPACSLVTPPGGVLPGGGFIPGSQGRLCFTTGSDVCRLDQVRIRTGIGFTTNSHRFTTVGEVMDYRAEALSNQNGGTVIVSIPGTYAWSWAWTIGQATIAGLAPVSGPTDNPNDSRVTALANGRTFAKATATITQDTIGNDLNRTLSGQGEVVVDICDNPWNIVSPSVNGFDDSASNCDRAGGGCQDFNFSLAYCRGNTGQTLLPDFKYQGTNSQIGVIEGKNTGDPTRLKSIFFKELADTRDVIGLLIFDNPDLLAPFDWFSRRFPQDTGGSSTVIGGYPALRTGTTAYIGVTDVSGGSARGLMFVIDFNSNNADSATQNIYNQILNSLTFNTNLTNLTERQQLINDTKRVQDLAATKLRLAAYQSEHSAYPGLQSGSYLIGMSTSAWPSWQQTLGNTLGRALGQDPKNTFADPCVAGDNSFEASTCWSEPKQQFQCPTGSHVYAYRASGTSYTLYAQLEYTGAGSFINAAGTNACSGIAGSSCQCFNYRLTP